MSDSTLNYFIARGLNADRLAFTPSPPTTPAAGPELGYLFYETDTGVLYGWDGAAWQAITSGAALADDSVSNAKLADMAQSTLKGRAAGAGTGDPTDLTATQATAILNAMVGDSGAGGTKGLAPTPAAGDAAANKFLKADGTWQALAGTGDVVGPASAIDDRLAAYDGTSGKLLQDSGVSALGIAAAIAAVDADLDAHVADLASPHDTEVNGGNFGATPTVDWDNGNQQRGVANANLTFTFSNPKAGAAYVLIVTQDATGGRTYTFPASVQWVTGNTPAWSTGASESDLIVLRYSAFGGGKYLASAVSLSDPQESFASQFGSPTQDNGNSGTSKTLDWNESNTHLLTLTGNCTLTLSNPIDGFRYQLALKQDGTGSRTVTWPAAVKWPGGTAPTLSTTAGKVDLVSLTWFASLGASGNYLAVADTNFTPA